MPGQTAVTPILYQNPSRTLTLLDIPTSMSLAQGTTDHPCADQIYASPPLKTPYPSTEPKSDKARAKVRQQNLLIEDGTNISDALLLQRLAEMKEQWHSKGEWCLPRKVSPFVVKRHGEKRKVNKLEGEEASIHTPGSVLPFDMNVDGNTLAPILNVEPNLEIPGSDVRVLRMDQPLILSSSSTPKTYTCSNIRQVINTLVHNPYATRLSLCLSDTNYTIPPGASFLLSKINEDTSPALSIAALTMYPDASESAGPGQFNFVLLDPPWQNRSVRRSASYDIRHSAGPMGVIRDVLEQHIAPGALVACWVTNNARSRELAREAFQVWDVDLLEEWVWLKTTDVGFSKYFLATHSCDCLDDRHVVGAFASCHISHKKHVFEDEF